MDDRPVKVFRSNQADAEVNADTIRRYWADRGYAVTVWLVKIVKKKKGIDTAIPTDDDGGGGEVVWGVRSNLVNGVPPGWVPSRRP